MGLEVDPLLDGPLLVALDVAFRLKFFLFKQKTAYELRISDWSADVCSSDLRASSQFFGEALLVLLDWQEAPVSPQVLSKRCAMRAREMSGNRIDRLDFTLETRQRPGIEQGHGRLTETLLKRFGTEQQGRVWRTTEGAGTIDRWIETQGQTGSMPSLEPAVEDVNAIALTQPDQQPPGPGGIGARTVIVKNDVAVVADHPGPQTLHQDLRLRQRRSEERQGGKECVRTCR